MRQEIIGIKEINGIKFTIEKAVDGNEIEYCAYGNNGADHEGYESLNELLLELVINY